MSVVRRREYAIITAIIVFLVLYSLGISCEDSASIQPVSPQSIVTTQPVDPVQVDPVVVPDPAVYPQPYPQPYPVVTPYPQPYPYPCYPGNVTVRPRYIRTPKHNKWTRPNYIVGEPVMNTLRFLFAPRWSSKGGGCITGC